MGLADRVAILNAGAIEQVGTPDEVHDSPATAFVCGFVGDANRIEGLVADGVFNGGGVKLAAKGVADGPACAFVRPYDLTLGGAGAFEATLQRVSVQGAVAHLDVTTSAGAAIEAVVARGEASALTVGQSVKLNAAKAHVFTT